MDSGLPVHELIASVYACEGTVARCDEIPGFAVVAHLAVYDDEVAVCVNDLVHGSNVVTSM